MGWGCGSWWDGLLCERRASFAGCQRDILDLLDTCLGTYYRPHTLPHTLSPSSRSYQTQHGVSVAQQSNVANAFPQPISNRLGDLGFFLSFFWDIIRIAEACLNRILWSMHARAYESPCMEWNGTEWDVYRGSGSSWWYTYTRDRYREVVKSK